MQKILFKISYFYFALIALFSLWYLVVACFIAFAEPGVRLKMVGCVIYFATLICANSFCMQKIKLLNKNDVGFNGLIKAEKIAMIIALLLSIFFWLTLKAFN
ncbi:MAG: hypothetical protein PHV37_06420 [Candidatus Gastranaerophilales bacterium]|nr:hypothetical protein [Candidatus Gastranaerophilales bacterium]